MNSRHVFLLGSFLLGAAFARAQANFPVTASGLKYIITEPAGGTQVRMGKVVAFHYVGTLRDGTVFADTHKTNQPVVFTVGKDKVLKGWEEGFLLLHGGDKVSFVVPPQLAYGDNPPAGVPRNAQVRFDVELLDVKNHRLSDLLRDTIAAKGVSEAERQLAREESEKFANSYVSEADLRQLAQEYRQQGKRPEATFVLSAAARLYPKSSEVKSDLSQVRAGK
jgi:hypothetical protein